MGVGIVVTSPEEYIFARGVERARLLIRMLSIPDPRVQLAAAQVIEECSERVMLVIEEIARTEEENHENGHVPSG
jgi:hypothetical protein